MGTKILSVLYTVSPAPRTVSNTSLMLRKYLLNSSGVKSRDWNQTIWAQIWMPPLTGSVTLDELVKLPKPQFPPL